MTHKCWAIFDKRSGFIESSGRHLNMDDTTSTALSSHINNMLSQQPNRDLWVSDAGDPPDPNIDIMELSIRQPRTATQKELDQKPEGLRKLRHARAKSRMAEIASKKHADVDTLVDGAYGQMPKTTAGAVAEIRASVTDLPAAKAALVALTRVVWGVAKLVRLSLHLQLAMLKRLDWSEGEN